jgi:hypothetical protein
MPAAPGSLKNKMARNLGDIIGSDHIIFQWIQIVFTANFFTYIMKGEAEPSGNSQVVKN